MPEILDGGELLAVVIDVRLQTRGTGGSRLHVRMPQHARGAVRGGVFRGAGQSLKRMGDAPMSVPGSGRGPLSRPPGDSMWSGSGFGKTRSSG